MNRMVIEEYDLQTLLKFKDEEVILSFANKYGLEIDESTILFEDVLRFLWLSNRAGKDGITPEVSSIDEPLIMIDEMWHNFILHTVSYTKFCIHYFGRYLHHNPNSVKTKNNQLTKEEKEVYISGKRLKYEAVYDHLGKDIFIRWYVHYPMRFPKKEISRRLSESSI